MYRDSAGFIVFASALVLALSLGACGPKGCPENCGESGHPGHPGFFGGGPGGPGRRGEMAEKEKERMARMKKELGITEAQEKKLKELRDARSAKMSALGEKIWALRGAVIQELGKPDYNADKARKAQAEMKVLSDKLEDERFEGLLEARKILTYAQIRRIEKLRPSRGGGPAVPEVLIGMGEPAGPGPNGRPPSHEGMDGMAGGHGGKTSPPPPDAR